MNNGTGVDLSEKTSSAVFFDKLKWMTSKEAAFYLRIAVGTLHNKVCQKQIPVYRDGGRLLFLRSDLDRQLKSSLNKRR